MSELQPTRFGKYLLLDKVAVGGMAQLYRAKITGIKGFEKLIAIKMLLPHLAPEKDLIAAFIDEARLAALLHHQNVAQIYDFGTLEGSYFIAMEYLLGKDLRQILGKSWEKKLQISNELSLYITSQVCSGLDYAHKLKDFHGKALDIIHRDISPQNIFVTYEGEVKIVDFGIAKAASQSTITQFGMIKGKVAYMSPEQASGQSIDYRSDIFSTGILLYEMVTSKRMFTGSDTLQILARVSRAEFEPPEEACGSLPPKIYKILHQALAKDPDKRYSSCGEMLADIEECMFDISSRPSSRGLSQYMKQLFEEEIAAEVQSLKELTVTNLDQQLAAEKEEQEAGEIREESKEPPQQQEIPKAKKKAGPLYAAVAVILAVTGILVAFWLKENLSTTPMKGAGGKSVKPSLPQPSEKPTPSEATPAVARTTEKGPDPLTEAKMLRDQAAELVEKNPEEAQSLLLKAIKLDPTGVQGHFHLGVVYTKLKDYPKAIETYQKAANLDPKFPDTIFNLGYLYAMRKEYAKSEEMYDRVVKLAPPYLDEAFCNLGIVQEKQGKRKQSMVNLERALSVNPKNEMAKKLLDKLKQQP